MRKLLYIKHRCLNTPLEKPLYWVRQLLRWPHRRRHPELHHIYKEEQRISTALDRLIKPNSNCLDIGCHIGSFLAELTRRAPQGKHTAFEAIPYKAAWLRKKFPHATIHQIALADEPGELTFHENLSRPGFSSLGTSRNDRDEIRKYIVKADTLDQVIPEDAAIDFIKIDIEGAELLALRGGLHLINRCKPAILFESGPNNANPMGLTHQQLYQFLTDELDYAIFLFADYLEGRPPLDTERFDQAHVYPFKAFNYLALPATSKEVSAAGVSTSDIGENQY